MTKAEKRVIREPPKIANVRLARKRTSHVQTLSVTTIGFVVSPPHPRGRGSELLDALRPAFRRIQPAHGVLALSNDFR